MIFKLAMLALAGALGTLSRYALSGAVQKITGTGFPYGTLVVNLTGCFAVGILWSLFESRFTVSSEMRLIILVGFMGAFTTFSTLILESSHLFKDAQLAMALGNIIAQNVIGILFLFIGMALGRYL